MPKTTIPVVITEAAGVDQWYVARDSDGRRMYLHEGGEWRDITLNRMNQPTGLFIGKRAAVAAAKRAGCTILKGVPG